MSGGITPTRLLLSRLLPIEKGSKISGPAHMTKRKRGQHLTSSISAILRVYMNSLEAGAWANFTGE